MYYRKRKPENTIKTNFSQKSSIVNVAKACSSVRREGGKQKMYITGKQKPETSFRENIVSPTDRGRKVHKVMHQVWRGSLKGGQRTEGQGTWPGGLVAN